MKIMLLVMSVVATCFIACQNETKSEPAKLASSDSCQSDSDCAAGSTCGNWVGGLGGICVRQTRGAGDSCQSNSECGSGYTCGNWVGGLGGICVRQSSRFSDSCQSDDDCSSNQTCGNWVGGLGGICLQR